MTYKGHDIYARVAGTYSQCLGIKDDGTWDTEDSGDIITNGDETLVWYEVEAVDPESGLTNMFTQLETIEAAQAVVDRSRAYLREQHPEDYEEDEE